jgi:hypothetical protein
MEPIALRQALSTHRICRETLGSILIGAAPAQVLTTAAKSTALKSVSIRPRPALVRDASIGQRMSA